MSVQLFRETVIISVRIGAVGTKQRHKQLKPRRFHLIEADCLLLPLDWRRLLSRHLALLRSSSQMDDSREVKALD